jgi:homocysteine S-methyltransferase
MARYRAALPQLSGEIYLTDAGLETDLMFNHGVEIREFAAHTLLETPAGRAALTRYFEGFLGLARDMGAGYILDSVTWRAHAFWAETLDTSPVALHAANTESMALAAGLRGRFDGNAKPIVLNAVIGPRGDAYRPDAAIPMAEAENYFAEQLGWLAATEADMVTALTFNQASEAAGFVRAARAAGLPAVVSFTVETDGRLPNGQALADAIDQVDRASDAYPAYFMVNCAHPDHFGPALRDASSSRRIRGVRANASRQSHSELDEAPELDAGDPHELAKQYRELASDMPWLNVFGGCCGSDLRHVTAIAHALDIGRNAIG